MQVVGCHFILDKDARLSLEINFASQRDLLCTLDKVVDGVRFAH